MNQQSVGVGLALLVALAPAVTRAARDRSRTAPPVRLPAARAAGAELIVGYKASCLAAERNRVAQICGATACREGYGSVFHVLSLAPGRSPEQEAERLRHDPRIRFAEPNGRVTALAMVTDPYFSLYQWDLADTGFGIHVPSAWDRTTGTGVTVAVVDTGIAYENAGGFQLAPDLTMATFVPGWDFIGNDAHPNDDNGHGTHVAGIIAANSNNGYGCAGIAPDARLMPVKVLGPDGSGPTSALADGIRFAADHGAQVINVSVGSALASDALKEAVQYALDKGAVIVAAAGNDGSNKIVYPAAYPGVISVGATRYDGQRAYYSNYGPSLDVVAPGGDPNVDQNGDGFPDGILEQTFATGNGRGPFGFYFKAGTSQAAPHVSGVAALVLSVRPLYTPEEVLEAIEKTATDLGPPGRDDQYGWGLVNAAAAVNYDPSAPIMNSIALDPRLDSSTYNFEGGGFQGWNTTDNNRASLFNSTQYAYKGQHSLQVALKGINDLAPGVIRVEPAGGATIPPGRTATAYVQLVGTSGVAARLVLYDGRGQPIVGSFIPLVPGRWLPVSLTVPPTATGPFRWMFLHFRAIGASFTGTCYVDSIGW